MSDRPVSGSDGSRALPAGFMLEEFELLEVVGHGGFGIVYRARDTRLEREVAIKEYMPATYAHRDATRSVSVSAPQYAEPFEAGRRSFINEARLLAQLDHPALVRVLRFWEANGTAYMAMPYFGVPTLRQYIERHGLRDEAWLRAWLVPMLEALELLHRQGICHRDIAPDNVMMLDDRRPVLLDFGAARKVIADITQNITVILKPGYAPLEQYTGGDGPLQGPWTDLYALAAVVRYCLSGKSPPPAPGRAMSDDMPPLAAVAATPVSAEFARAIDTAMAVRVESRPRDVAEFRALLAANPQATAAPMPEPERAGVVAAPAVKVRARGGMAVAAIAGGVVTVLVAALVWWTAIRSDPRATADAPPQQAAEKASSASIATPSSSPPVPATPPSSPPSSPPAAATSASIAAPSRADRIAIVRSALNDVAAAATPGWRVSLEVEKTVLTIGRDRLEFRVNSARSGYLHVLLLESGAERLTRIFPNEIDGRNRVAPGTRLELPRAGWALAARGPAGRSWIVALVTPSPRDFSEAGLPGDGGLWDAARALAAWRERGAGVFAGRPTGCQPAGATCDAYGAALVEIEERDP
ncbi:MAG: serine/threonine-protein kinase [Burkholderiaceae bacterium]